MAAGRIFPRCAPPPRPPEEPTSEAAENSGNDAAEVEPAAEVEDEADQAKEAAADAGTRDNPLPLGETVASDDWAVNINAWDSMAVAPR